MARVDLKADALEARAVLQAHLDESDDDDFAEIMRLQWPEPLGETLEHGTAAAALGLCLLCACSWVLGF